MRSDSARHGPNKICRRKSDESIVPVQSTALEREEPLEVVVNESYRSREKRKHKTFVEQVCRRAGIPYCTLETIYMIEKVRDNLIVAALITKWLPETIQSVLTLQSVLWIETCKQSFGPAEIGPITRSWRK